MTWKRVTYSVHAARQMRLREFSRTDVQWLLAKGERTREPTRRGEQRWGRRGYIGKDEALVVYLERPDEIHVVTVQWLE